MKTLYAVSLLALLSGCATSNKYADPKGLVEELNATGCSVASFAYLDGPRGKDTRIVCK